MTVHRAVQLFLGFKVNIYVSFKKKEGRKVFLEKDKFDYCEAYSTFFLTFVYIYGENNP